VPIYFNTVGDGNYLGTTNNGENNYDYIGDLKNIAFYDYALTAPFSGPTAAPSSGLTKAPSAGPTVAPSTRPTVAPSSGLTAAPSLRSALADVIE